MKLLETIFKQKIIVEHVADAIINTSEIECSNCHIHTSDNSKFCTECGIKIKLIINLLFYSNYNHKFKKDIIYFTILQNKDIIINNKF